MKSSNTCGVARNMWKSFIQIEQTKNHWIMRKCSNAVFHLHLEFITQYDSRDTKCTETQSYDSLCSSVSFSRVLSFIPLNSNIVIIHAFLLEAEKKPFQKLVDYFTGLLSNFYMFHWGGHRLPITFCHLFVCFYVFLFSTSSSSSSSPSVSSTGKAQWHFQS
jgi:hypothetical protein